MGFKQLLNKTCVIRRFTSTAKDAHGNPIKVWSDLATDVPCRLQARRGRETTQPVQVVVGTHTLFLEPRDITEKDQIIIGSDTFEVLFVEDAAGQGHHLEVDLEIAKE